MTTRASSSVSPGSAEKQLAWTIKADAVNKDDRMFLDEHVLRTENLRGMPTILVFDGCAPLSPFARTSCCVSATVLAIRDVGLAVSPEIKHPRSRLRPSAADP